MARGWSVFYPLVRTTRMDLIAVSENGERVRRIEVRCAKRSGSTVKFNTKHNAVCDNFAVVITGEPVIYDPDIGGGRGSS